MLQSSLDSGDGFRHSSEFGNVLAVVTTNLVYLLAKITT